MKTLTEQGYGFNTVKQEIMHDIKRSSARYVALDFRGDHCCIPSLPRENILPDSHVIITDNKQGPNALFQLPLLSMESCRIMK